MRPYALNSRVLELYAGTGRFGMALMEEGIQMITWVESHKKLCQDLQMRACRIKQDVGAHFVIRCQKVERFLSRATSDRLSFDLVFADPPFHYWGSVYANWLFTHVREVIVPLGIFLVKHPTQMVACPGLSGFHLFKVNRLGDSTVSLFRYEGEASTADTGA